MRTTPPGTAEYRHAAQRFIELIDGLDELKVNERKQRHLRLLHGLVWYTRDCVRSALLLIDNQLTTPAAAQVRVALEHAVLVQWLMLADGRIESYLAQKDFEIGKFKQVAEDAGIALPEDLREEYQAYDGLKSVRDLQEVRRMFRQVDDNENLYLQYRFLSGSVHPSTDTAARYSRVQDDGSVMLMADEVPGPVDAMMFTLALSLSLAVSPYLDLVQGKPYKTVLEGIADEVNIPLWATADGKPPRLRFG